jgi:hypothetical protein
MVILDKIKAHPVASGLIIIGIGLVALYMLRGSSPTAVSYDTGTDVSAATGLQAAQLQAASQSQQVAAALQANESNNAAAIELAKIQAATSVNNNTIAADVASQQINAQQQLGSLYYTLNAAVATNAQNQQTEQTRITVGGVTQQQQILADALVQQSANQTAANIAAINASASTSAAYITAATQIAKSKCGLVGKIFGC